MLCTKRHLVRFFCCSAGRFMKYIFVSTSIQSYVPENPAPPRA